jgi:type IV pilus assembly protein PilQ
VRSLLQVIADFTNFNIITTDTVQGNLTLRLKDVPWDQALDIILEAKGLGMTRTGNVIRVAPKKELDAEVLAQREVTKKIEELEPLRTEVFRLNFAKADDVVKTLKDATSSGGGESQTTNRLLSTRGSAIADTRTNQVFVTDVPGRLDAVRDYIRRVDSPKRQVMIQARLVEAREGFGRALGIRLGGADLRTIRGGDAGYSIGGGARARSRVRGSRHRRDRPYRPGTGAAGGCADARHTAVARIRVKFAAR